VPALFATAEARGLLLHTAYNRRQDPEIQRAREEIRQRRHGAPVGATLVSRDFPYPTAAYLATSGNLFKDCVVHDLDYLTWILDDDVTALSATASMSDEVRACGMWEYSSVHLTLASGMMANLINARVAPSYDHRLDIYCDHGAVRVTNPEEGATGRAFSDRFAQSYHNQIAAFIDGVSSVRKGAAPTPNVALGRTLYLANLVRACELSVSRGGQTLALAADGRLFSLLGEGGVREGSLQEGGGRVAGKVTAGRDVDGKATSAAGDAVALTTDDSDSSSDHGSSGPCPTEETAAHAIDARTTPAETTAASVLRTYDDTTAARVRELYATMRRKQSVEHVQRLRAKYVGVGQLGTVKMSVWDALGLLSRFVDVSDPDLSLPNHIHAFQTAEGLRAMHMPEWLQLTGLVHDLGKMIYLRGCDEDGTSMREQWSIVGDTWLVGCAMPSDLVFAELSAASPDKKHPERCTEMGIYAEGCGLDAAMCAFGHDEYLYEVLRQTPGVRLPKEALYVVRYHSLYAWHDKGCYARIESDFDRSMKGWVKLFNQHDLYTKRDVVYSPSELAELREYYATLVEKYLPAELHF